jgi:two-component system, OmpR family, response regulator
MRLLVIEDDPDLNRQLATALTDAGYVVDRAFDGAAPAAPCRC